MYWGTTIKQLCNIKAQNTITILQLWSFTKITFVRVFLPNFVILLMEGAIKKQRNLLQCFRNYKF